MNKYNNLDGATKAKVDETHNKIMAAGPTEVKTRNA